MIINVFLIIYFSIVFLAFALSRPDDCEFDRFDDFDDDRKFSDEINRDKIFSIDSTTFEEIAKSRERFLAKNKLVIYFECFDNAFYISIFRCFSRNLSDIVFDR